MAAKDNEFFEKVAKIIEQARKYVGRTVDLTMCISNFEIGRMIVEQEQDGKAHAKYGSELFKKLSTFLNRRFGKGFSVANLRNARQFYQIYAPAIHQTLSVESQKGNPLPIRQSLISIFDSENLPAIRQSLISVFYPFKLSWTHYLILMRIKNDNERSFYEIEAINQHWTVRQLQRQYGSSLYERLALSRNKNGVMRLAKEGQTLEKPHDMLKNPLVLEFLGMDEKEEYSESDLETAIINKLQAFLLELGKGFLFEAR